MNQTPKLTITLHSLSFLSAILIISFVLLSRIGANGIYTYTVIGALYEMLWFPLLSALFCIPIVLFILALKKRVTWTKLIFPSIVSVATLLYLTTS